MKGVLLQDLFSNVLLAMLALLLLSIRLVGEPRPDPPPDTLCEIGGEPKTDWLVLASTAGTSGQTPGEVLGIDMHTDGGQDISIEPRPKETHIALVNGGCLRACYRCAADAAPVLDLSRDDPVLANCTATSC
ncbi:MAG: hypothetical protein M5U09_01475 [Gammaproteobacteria bacterium]|nr:hypothetical protein [Gammaproteobacteria bacterium]